VSQACQINALVRRCAFEPQMPKRAEMLALTVAQLKKKEQKRTRALMRQVGLPERMARRATEVAHFNAAAAINIVSLMLHLFRRSTLAKALQSAGYFEKQAERARRHRRGGNRPMAELIEDHLRELHSATRERPHRGIDKLGLIDPRVDVVSTSRPRLSFAR
jgi:hypothetical protein